MSRREIDESLPTAELAALVDSLSAEIQAVLTRHCVSEEAGEEIVYETMMAVARRWNDLTDRRRWFLEALEHACAREGTEPTPDTD